MKISLNWLRDYVEITESHEKLAERLTMAGLEVESIENLGDKYKDFVVGKIVEVIKHPKADKLSLCKVDIGKKILKIVCGASNVAVGQKVPVGLVGAIIPRSQHVKDGKSAVLERVQIRGETSHGMICSAYELDLGEDADGILVLEKNPKVGTPLANYLGLTDIVFDIGITPNRPDCLSHVGVARELAAIFNKRIQYPSVKLKESREHVRKAARVKILNIPDCLRYSARVIFEVKVQESPKWMKDRLNAVGIRSINNIVDTTNYVLMELGHPLHAFDYDTLQDHTIVVKRARSGEQFTTLDGISRELRDDTLLICDSVRPIAIAGVMGGLNTEISGTTRNVLIESAYFDPTGIRRTSKHLGISTEASLRFERGVDPNITLYALDEVASLIEQIAGGRALRGTIDEYPKKIGPKKVSLRIQKVNAILGTSLSKKTVIKILSKLEIPLSKSRLPEKRDDTVSFKVPTFRTDVESEIDLIEEIGRVYGYDNIETKLTGRIHFSESNPLKEIEVDLREYFAASGYHEVVANSMQEKSLAAVVSSNYVEVLHPISKDMAALRTSLVPGILQIVVYNIHREMEDLRLFELGKVYFVQQKSKKPSIENYREENRLLLALSGKADPTRWDASPRDVDIYDIKGEIETLFSKIFLDKVNFIYYSTTKTLTDLTIDIEINKTYLGYLGRVSAQTRKLFDLKKDVYVGEISLDVLRNYTRKNVSYEPLPRYPSVVRDLAFVVDENQSVQELINTIRDHGGGLINNIELFDIYVGDKIGKGKKSCAFTIQFLSRERTLTEEEIDRLINQIVSAMASRFQAVLRAT